MQRDGGADRLGLALQAGVVDAGAAADAGRRRRASRVVDRGGGRGVADSHLAETSRSGSEASASMPKAMAPAQLCSSIAGSLVMSPVG